MIRTPACLALIAFSVHAAAQTCVAELPGARRAESPHYVLAYRPSPGPVAIGKPFNLDVVACARGGAKAADRLSVDARMPEHNHGMNYKAVVKPAGGGRFKAEGLMFHMPGRWEYVFEVGQGGEREQLTDSVVLQ